MATTIINNTINVKSNDGDNGYYFRMEVIVNSYDSASNYWNVTINHYAYGVNKQHYSSYSSPNSLIKTTIDGTTTTLQTTQVSRIDLNTEKKIGTWTGNIYANADGNKNVTFICKYAPNNSTSYLPKTNTNSVNVNMPTIPRYASITSYSVNKVNETSLNVTWGANATCDYAWYRIRTSNGSYGNWIGGVGTNFNIDGLTANTNYVVQIRVRRQDSQLTTDSGEYGQSTYAYPYISSAPNFTIGNTTTLGIYNPLGRSCDLYILNPLEQNNSKNLGTTTGQSKDIPNTSEWQTFFYDGIPNSSSGLYRVRLVCSEVSRDTTVNGGTYSVNPYINKPDVSNMSASYTADLTNLTNDNQTVINGASTITYTILAGATALNGASISKYIVTWGSASDEITDIQNSASLVKGSGNTISVTIQDSRGITNTYSTSISEVITYTSPTQLSISPDRLNGVGENVYLDVSGIIYYDKFGTNGVSNGITNITYSITDETAQDEPVSLSSLSYSEQSSTNHTQKFSIVDAPIDIDGQGGGFDTSKTYEVTVYVTDKSGTTVSIKGTIKDGKFAMIKGRDSNGDYHTGINGLPDNNYALKVHGNIGADNLLSPLDIYPVGSIYMSVNSTNPSTFFGGTWEAFGTGKVLVGQDTSQIEFDTLGETGGSKTNTLQVANLPNQQGWFQSRQVDGANVLDTYGGGGVFTYTNNGGDQWGNAINGTTPASNRNALITYNNGGSSTPFNNLQPYIVVSMWQRTA